MHSTTTRQWLIAVWSCCFIFGVVRPVAAEDHVVSIRDYRFSPEILSIKAGDTVRWINLEKRSSHSILFDGAETIESERLFPGEVWSRHFDVPGKFQYHCGPHPEMFGMIEVFE
jgi:plastocyanin